MPTTNKKNKASHCTSPPTFSQKWSRALQAFTTPLLKPFLALSNHAATHPKAYIISTIIFSTGIMFLGFSTNFNQISDEDIWSPQGSKPVEHGDWINDESNFPKVPRSSLIIVHRDGKSIFGDGGSTSLAVESGQRMFESLDHFRNTPGYDELCSLSRYINPTTGKKTCQVIGASMFWNDTASIFEAEATSNEEVLSAMSAKYYPSGGLVDFDQIIGFNKFDENGIMNFGKSYVTVIQLPADKDDQDESEAFSKEFENDVLDRMLDLQDKWNAEVGNDFKVEIIAERSFNDEFERGVTKDLPLLPVVFILMSVLCIIIFSKRDPVLSQSWLGFGAVVTVLLAIMASFGLLFTIGVPFTALTPLLPFIMFGIGLDAAFIISGAYARTDQAKDPIERVNDTMKEIGGTILLTTLSSSLAFALGAVSSIPAVRYLVLYAFPTVIIDFIFQITFFVAIIVIDQRRIEENRRDCCFCCTKKDTPEASKLDLSGHSEKHFADRIMARYADFLVKPAVKWWVIAFFCYLLAFFSWRTSLLTQDFDLTDILPSDSYIRTWVDSYEDYYEANGVRAGVYFRDVDFSDPNIQDQMESYVAELAAMPYSGANEPFKFWLRDFKVFLEEGGEEEDFQDLTFEEQMQRFLAIPVYYDSYSEDIVLDENGVMTASRTLIRLDNVDDQDVLEVVDALELQRSISENQPVNQGKDNWAFFTFADNYYTWEFYRIAPEELRFTTIIGTITVSFLALVFIPHWSATLFVGPLVAVLYIDLLGFIQLFGVHVNPVMYISTVMSIGLMVDFVMHVALRYMETKGNNRTQRTKETLETLGASIMIGGFSTLVGVLPLALSTSEIFWTTFVIFFGLVLLGLLHGLVLLPVLLSMFGPLDSIEEEDVCEVSDVSRAETGSAISDTEHASSPSNDDNVAIANTQNSLPSDAISSRLGNDLVQERGAFSLTSSMTSSHTADGLSFVTCLTSHSPVEVEC